MSVFGKIAGAAAAAMIAAMATGAVAQDYPTREIKLVVPTAPGGVVDATARVIQPALAEALGQPVIVENLPGAGNTVGVGQVARSEPDGYTLVLGVNGPIVMAPHLYSRLPYDSVNDLRSAGIFAETYLTLAVKADSPFQTIDDVVAAAKERPGELTYGTAGFGSAHQIAGELLNHHAGIEINHIPFQGGGPAMESLLGGHIDMSYATLAAALPHVESGTLRILALAESKRIDGHPDIPTIDETVPGVTTASWLGIFAPKAVPDEIIERLNDAINQAMARDDVVSGLERVGVYPHVLSIAESDGTVVRDLEFWREAIGIAGIEPQ